MRASQRGLAGLMAAVVLGAIMMQLDATMTNIAYNTLLSEFHTSLLTLQWIGTGYLLSMTVVMALSGWALDRYGGRAMWTFCITMFLAGSVLCGIAWSAESLIVFRVIQGLGAGMVLPLGMALLATAAGPDRLGRAMGVMGVPAALGPVLGPVAGGFLVSDLGWRWIFFINVPICVAAIVVAWRVMPTDRSAHRAPLDVLGLLLLSPACAVLVYGLTEAGRYGGFTDPRAALPLAAGVVLLGGFVVHALRLRGEPILDLRLLRMRSFLSSSLVLFLAGVALFGAGALLPLYFQQARGYGAMGAGLLLIPQGIGMGVSLFLSGRLSERFSPRTLVLVGLTLTIAGGLVLTQLDAHTGEFLVGAALLLSGGGIGAVMAPAMTAALRDIKGGDIPRASAANRILMQLGASFGSAVLLIALQDNLNQLAAAANPDAAGAYAHAFWWLVAFAAAAVPFAFAMPGRTRARQLLH